MASSPENAPASAPPAVSGHSGGTGWEALMPLDWDRLRHLTNEPVPQHLKRWWFSLGGTPAYLFFIQLTTGLLLTFYYHPGSDAAYESMQRITYEVPFGWFIRTVHMWSANLMVVTVILHLLRTFFTRAYRHPRQLSWFFGVGLLLLTLSMGFTGYSLVYEQLSFWGATVATNLTESVPLVGPPLAAFIRGGPEVGSGTMTRLFLLHIAILPVVMIGLLGLHLTFVRLHGVTEYEFAGPPLEAKKGPLTFVPPLLGLFLAIGALLALVAAAVGRWPFDLVGYAFLPGSSRILFLLMAGGLGVSAVAVFRRSLAGLLAFLVVDILILGRLVRDLLTHEAPNPGLWGGFVLIFGVALVLALVSHRLFREPLKPGEAKTFNFFPDHALTEIMIGTGLLFALTLLALLFPAELGDKANPQVTPDHIKPEWYFFFQFRLLKVSPGLPALGLTSLQVSVLLTGVLLGIVFFWPWIDRFLEKLAPGRNLPVYVGIVGFLWFLAFTVWEAFAH